MRELRPSHVRRAAAGIVMVGAVLGTLTGCALPPANWSDDVGKMSTVAVLKTPPPDGVTVASATDQGSIQLGAARDPGIAKVYVTSASIQELVLYYSQKYPEYQLAQVTLDPTQRIGLIGRGSPRWVVINIEIEAKRPYTTPHYDLTPSRPSPSGHNTYVTVIVSGQPR